SGDAAVGGAASLVATTPSMKRLEEQQQASLFARLIKKLPQQVSLHTQIGEALGDALDKSTSTMYKIFSGLGAPMPQSHLTQELIIVLDDEPSSAIACALGHDSYHEQVRGILGGVDYESLDADTFVRIALDMPSTQSPMKVAFESMLPKVNYKCDVTIYYPVEFAALRKLVCGGDAAFVHSMARSQIWDKQQGGGASKAKFVATRDNLYLLKSVPSIELKNFQAFARKYFEYLFTASASQMPTALVKIVGMFSIDINGQRDDYMVMEKMFTGCSISRTFDLKGSMLNRLKPEGSAVLQDENLRRMMYRSPLVVDNVSKAKLGLAVWNDSWFLSTVSVMDYSILVGIDERQSKFHVGIIDYIRPYSWDKAVEFALKATPGIISGTGKRPTVVSPGDYRDRFREATW
ncbi:MAG: hypothetical protein K2Z81_23890, partial [Cyanobacteria bacterium]|nr:hypothetical protein [Cyanobacteriota bacterium]